MICKEEVFSDLSPDECILPKQSVFSQNDTGEAEAFALPLLNYD